MKQKQKHLENPDNLLRAQLAFYGLVEDLLRSEESLDLSSPSAEREIFQFDVEWQRKINEFFLWMISNRMYLRSLPDWQAAMLVQTLKDQVCAGFAAEDELELICPSGK